MAKIETRKLATADYIVVALMLTCSTCIGIYHAHKGRKRKQGTEGYLLANRSMNFLPVAISIAVNFKSAVTIISTPADIYYFGIVYSWCIVALICVTGPFVGFIILPVLYNLRISSAYEYLERRFGRTVRMIATNGFMLQTLLYMGVNIYGPALALSRVTGFPQSAAMLTTGLVCLVYTTLGGLRGVIWSDVFQAAIMTSAMLAFLIRGAIVAGGADVVWNHVLEGGRSNIFRFDPDPRVRYTAWTTVAGYSVIWTGSFGTSQTNIQRYISVNSLTKARWALFIGVMGVVSLTVISLGTGLVLYAMYHSCDPILSGCIEKRDELIPYAVMDVFHSQPGMTGLFMAGVFSASLSTVSSGMNSMVSLVITDYIKPNTDWTDYRYETASKVLTACLGVMIIAMGFAASGLGAIITMSISIVGSFHGAFLGIFMMGILMPFVNSWGAGTGFMTGVAISLATFMGRLVVGKPDYLTQKLPVSTSFCPAGCNYLDSINATLMIGRNEIGFTTAQPDTTLYADSYDLSYIESYLSVSYLVIPVLGLIITVFAGVIVSLLTGGWKARHFVEKSTIDPISWREIGRCLPSRLQKYCFSTTTDDGNVKPTEIIQKNDINITSTA